MTLMAQIKEKQLQARKAGHAEAVLYTTLLGEAAMVGKNDGNRETNDSEVIAIVKKFIKNIDDTITHLSKAGITNASTQRELLDAERKCLEQFLPLQLSEFAIEQFVQAQIAGGATNMGLIMKALKEKHDGQYDGKIASNIIKSILN